MRMTIAAFIILYLPISAFANVDFEQIDVNRVKPFISDDGSEIRSLPGSGEVETVHCRLAPGGVIEASRHKTVSQIWYTLSGQGELWLKSEIGVESVVSLRSGISVTVPLGYAFQFRNTAPINLDIIIVNTTKWSGAGELIPVENHWALPHK